MKIQTLDGKTIEWNPVSQSNTRAKSSQYHTLAREFLHKIFPTVMILEEVSIQVSKKEKLYLDFYIPALRVAVEVQGEQHFKFTPFFHGTPYEFIQSKRRDSRKKEWCELNEIQIVPLNFNETIEEWRKKFDEDNL